MAMNGTDILLYVNTGTEAAPAYTVVGSQRDVTFDETNEEIDYSSKDGRAFRGGPGRYKATVSLDALYVPDDAAYLALKDALRDGTMILIERLEVDGVDEIADAFVTSLSEAGPDQGEATVSCGMTIDGEWTAVGT